MQQYNISQIIFGNKTLEMRPSGIDKSSSVKAILGDFGVRVGLNSASPPEHRLKRSSSTRSKRSVDRYPMLSETGDIDFLLCIGDGQTDEIVFQVLKESFGDRATCATVGKKQTAAQCYIEDVAQVARFLSLL